MGRKQERHRNGRLIVSAAEHDEDEIILELELPSPTATENQNDPAVSTAELRELQTRLARTEEALASSVDREASLYDDLEQNTLKRNELQEELEHSHAKRREIQEELEQAQGRLSEIEKSLQEEVDARQLIVGQLQSDLETIERREQNLRDEWDRVTGDLSRQLEEARAQETTLREQLEQALQQKASGNAELRALAYNDPLTGLANQNFLNKLLEEHFAQVLNYEIDAVMMVIDLDHFGQLNDRFGFEWGDYLLRQLGEELRKKLPQDVFLGRRAEDEFVVLFFEPNGRNRAQQIGRAVWEVVTGEREIAGQKLPQTASIGIAVAPGSAQSPSELKKEVDAALDYAKENGRNRMQLYDERLKNRLESSRQLKAQLYDDCVQQRIRITYEPIVELASGKLEGVELSLSWRHQADTEKLHELLHESELSAYMGNWLLEAACQATHHLGKKCYAVTPLLPGQAEKENFAREFMGVIQSHRLSPDRICLLVSAKADFDELRELHNWGVGIVFTDVSSLLNTCDQWGKRKRRILKLNPDWSSVAPEAQPQTQICAGLVTFAAVTKTHCLATGIHNFQHAEFFRIAACGAGMGPYFGSFGSLEEMNAKQRWKTKV